MRKVISTDQAPGAVGAYSQGVRAGGSLFVSGQLPINPETGKMLAGDMGDQARQVLRNVLAIVRAGGLKGDDIVKTTVYLRNLDDFGAVNEVYAEVFGANPPARACVEVSRLPKGALIEIEAIACV